CYSSRRRHTRAKSDLNSYVCSSDHLAEYTENNNESTYFLGTIVSYENDSGEQEIIDGQQRITSLFLLLRALYSKLNSMTETKEVDRKSTRLNSSHVSISYAVFCLKK